MDNHFFVIFAVSDVSCAVNSCINHSFFYIYNVYKWVGWDFPLVMDIIWHFFTLNLIPQVSHHFSRESKSLCRATLCALERMGRYKRQSPANSLTCEVTTDGMSLIWSKNKIGPSTVPCGTPDNTSSSWDLNPSTTTPWTRSTRKASVQRRMGPFMP